MERQTSWKCTECGKTFSVGEWLCKDGQNNHVVAQKEYLLADAPSDPGHPAPGSPDVGSLRDGRTRICNIPPDKQIVRNGETQRIPGGYVEFVRGRFSSSDPETQYYLERKGGFCNEDQWRSVWLSDKEKLNLQRMELTAMSQRIENERNELLAKVKRERVGA